MNLVNVTPASWLVTQRPGRIQLYTPAAIAALVKAVDAVDRDISEFGHVTVETVEKCRDAQALAKGLKK